MKHFFPLILLLLSSIGHAQWPAERKQAYDAAAPQEPEMQTPATYLSMRPAGDIRLTTTSSTPFDLVENISLASLPNELNLQAWRGERCSTQLAVQANGLARQLSVSCTSLSNGEKCIPATVSLIRYTVAHGTPTADIIGGETTCDNPAGVNRGIWVQIDVPQNASPGIYQGQVIVSAEGCAETRQTIRLHVSEENLPAPDQWKLYLDLWQHPQAVARWHDVEPWSPEHFALLRPLMKRLAAAGQKCITTTLLDEAWNGQTYDTFPSMVRWIRGVDGQMRYDYTALDAWVSFMHDEIGIRGQISCYTMIPWHLRVRFFDEATGRYDSIRAVPGTPEYTELWAPFLRDFHAHMQQKGWAEKTCISIDERPDNMVRAAMKLLEQEAPSFRISSAVDKPSDLTREVYSIAPVITHAGTALGDLLKERQAAGKLTSFYVCLHPKKPNTFTHSNPAEAEWLGFFAAANHLDGFLRWAYNSWNRNPFECTDFVHWPSGDCFLVYPGNRSSIRFERLRDGIENYEKINLLRARAGKSPEAAAAVQHMDEILADIFSVERSTGDSHTDDVKRARLLIEQTARRLRD
ncbi:MAG: DUF4091 domain-containing protein [Akkermansia sp.]|nr:DUF4091 domain-containing protein [Akkermansia sp.]